MSKTVIIGIDNCIVDVNNEFKRMGYRTDVYPSPIPSHVFSDGSLFSNALPMENMIKKIEEMVRGNRPTFLTARTYGC